MRRMKKFFGTLAVMVMMLSLAMTVQAKDYTDPAKGGQPYKVRIFAGNQGKFKEGKGDEGSNGEYKTYTGASGIFNIGNIEVTDKDKYYVKGIKPSGLDISNKEAEIGKDGNKLENASFDITKDKDYVVVYGLLKDPVKYYIYYLDANGNELLPREEFTANIGDKPIVGYRAVDGYIPQAYNLTMTLLGPEDRPEGNIFTFRYTPVPTGGGGGDRTVYDEEIVNTTNTTPVIVPGAGGDAAGAAGGGVAVVPGDGDAADAGAAGAGDAGEAAAPEEPQELIDLDDEEVPLANIPGSNGGGLGVGSEPGSFFVNMPPAVIVGVVSMAVLVVAAAWYLLFMRKKKGTGEDGQE